MGRHGQARLELVEQQVGRHGQARLELVEQRVHALLEQVEQQMHAVLEQQVHVLLEQVEQQVHVLLRAHPRLEAQMMQDQLEHHVHHPQLEVQSSHPQLGALGRVLGPCQVLHQHPPLTWPLNLCLPNSWQTVAILGCWDVAIPQTGV